MFVILKPEAGPKVWISEGATYQREFDRAEQPFEIHGEEIRRLAATGLFEEFNGPSNDPINDSIHGSINESISINEQR